MILVSEKKVVFKYDSKNQSVEWRNEFDTNVAGVFRVDDLVFITTTSWWGSPAFTSLIDFSSGKKKWTIEKVLYGIHIKEKKIIFIDTKKEIVSISLETGQENFRVKMSGFRWYEQPKISLINNKIYLFSLKKTFLLNEANGSLGESKLPSKINPKETIFLIDEFQMKINTLPGTSSDAGMVMATGDAGGDGGGGGDAGGGGE
tara:strand:+ start:2161 stop:2769 length:609 start_codon:yes stop_codon:yes gene_type:complete